MAKVIIHLNDNEFNALIALAHQEYRAPKAQASLIIRRELEKLGMVPATTDVVAVQEGK